jgi:hypothetical protein
VLERGKSSGSGSDKKDYMMTANNSSVEGSMYADAEKLSPYPMSEGTFSALCVAIQNDNGEEGDDKIYAECDNSDEEGICQYHTL